MLLALDPSVASPGAALFMGGRLLVAGRVRVTKRAYQSDGERWLGVAQDILDFAEVHGAYVIEDIETIVFERPQIYRATKSKGDPNQLIGLAGIAMALVGLCKGCSPLKILSPTPDEWTGQVEKDTKGSAKDSPRARRILSRLDDAERKLVPNQHDAIDAVGLGLHALDRYEVRRVLTNGKKGP